MITFSDATASPTGQRAHCTGQQHLSPVHIKSKPNFSLLELVWVLALHLYRFLGHPADRSQSNDLNYTNKE